MFGLQTLSEFMKEQKRKNLREISIKDVYEYLDSLSADGKKIITGGKAYHFSITETDTAGGSK